MELEKKIVWVGMIAGSVAGGLIPGLWDAGLFSLSMAVFSAAGGIAGLWAGYKFAYRF